MKLYHHNGQVVFQQEVVISASLATIWELLTTTTGLSKWFPELKADQLSEKKILTFEADGFKAEMAVLVYEEMTDFKLMWDTGEVSFHLKEVMPDETIVEFLEVLPVSFPNLYQDIAGWHYELKRLKGSAEGNEVIFTADCVKQKAEELQLLMKEQKDSDK